MDYIKGCLSSCCDKITKYYESEINNNSNDTEKNNNIDENNKKDDKEDNKEIKNDNNINQEIKNNDNNNENKENTEINKDNTEIKDEENENINENKSNKDKDSKNEDNKEEEGKEITDSKKEEEINEENENINENKDDKNKEKEEINEENEKEDNDNINENEKEEIKSKNSKEEEIEEDSIDENENNEQHSDINNKSLGEMLKEVNLPDNLTGNYRMPNVNNDNDNNDNEKLQKLINDINDQGDKKDIKKAENKDLNKKVEIQDLKPKPNGIKKNKHHGINNLKLQSYTGNKKILSKPSQTFEEIQKTNMHLHNFLTRIVIEICKLEESFREDNHGNCSEFWKNLVGDNKKTFETNDNLFTRVLDRNYNHFNIRDNNHILQLLGNDFGDIKGEPTTSEIVNQMVQRKRCEQLERILRISSADQ